MNIYQEAQYTLTVVPEGNLFHLKFRLYLGTNALVRGMYKGIKLGIDILVNYNSYEKKGVLAEHFDYMHNLHVIRENDRLIVANNIVGISDNLSHNLHHAINHLFNHLFGKHLYIDIHHQGQDYIFFLQLEPFKAAINKEIFSLNHLISISHLLSKDRLEIEAYLRKIRLERLLKEKEPGQLVKI